MKKDKINWCLVILELGEKKIQLDYYKFIQTHPKLSQNRCAYYVIKQYFTSESLKFYRKHGHFPGCSL